MMPENKDTAARISATMISSAIVILGVGFGGGFATERYLVEHGASNAIVGSVQQPANVDFSPVWKAWDVINDKFVPAAVASTTPIATTTAQMNQDRVWGLIAGLAASVNDPYTFFLPPQQNQDFSQDM